MILSITLTILNISLFIGAMYYNRKTEQAYIESRTKTITLRAEMQKELEDDKTILLANIKYELEQIKNQLMINRSGWTRE